MKLTNTAIVPQKESRSHISTKAMVWAVHGSLPGTRRRVFSSSLVGLSEARTITGGVESSVEYRLDASSVLVDNATEISGSLVAISR